MTPQASVTWSGTGTISNAAELSYTRHLVVSGFREDGYTLDYW